MGGWSRSYADYCTSLPVMGAPRVRTEGDGVDGRRGLHSKVTEEVVEDVVESEVIVGAAGSSGSSSSGTYFTAADTEEVKEL